jgi:hypothetical protein
MAFIRIKDSKRPESELVYQGPVTTGCEAIQEEGHILLWGLCQLETTSHAEFFFSPEEARRLAKELLDAVTTIETGIS